jgi:hypothetical protein
LFLNAVYRARPEILKKREVNAFLLDQDDLMFKFETVPDDAVFFRAILEGKPGLQPETPSQNRLQNAHEFFAAQIATDADFNLRRWVQVLANSTVLVHAVDGYSEACVIFETVNDRGKRLTDLESLKSFLMRVVTRTSPSPGAEDQAVTVLQGSFSAI